MDVDHIDTYSPGAVVNFQRSVGSIVPAKILAPTERGADCQFITYPPPPLYKLRPCPSYSRRRDHIALGPNFITVPNTVQPQKAWVW